MKRLLIVPRSVLWNVVDQLADEYRASLVG